ncbi:hypothetical protein EHQ58_16720 [Leptospira ognonensis]|uniref:Uncharacterized protein n=1 Tax=Leptospira ognonensis TaxID=2484945 RepID=A0A4V3JQL3_9LEPT|nr:hypothetical protein [Leptospira ognonensis]TGL56275.1 hypothetical protein EHQ58_16720 [Leptospira ognonensis]
MKKFGSIVALISLSVAWNVFSPLMSQTKEGFYDTNNYDLRNIPGYDAEGNVLQDVDQPPTFQRPDLATPKDVRTKYDPLASIPGAGTNLPTNLQTQPNNNQYQSANNSILNKSPINPLTGELNPGALQNQGTKSRGKREAIKKLREEFDEDTVYEEDKFRRGYIIFFLTLPFALGASAALASVLVVTKTLTGSLIMITGTAGLGGTNVYLDQQRLEENRKKKAALKSVTP